LATGTLWGRSQALQESRGAFSGVGTRGQSVRVWGWVSKGEGKKEGVYRPGAGGGSGQGGGVRWRGGGGGGCEGREEAGGGGGGVAGGKAGGERDGVWGRGRISSPGGGRRR